MKKYEIPTNDPKLIEKYIKRFEKIYINEIEYYNYQIENVNGWFLKENIVNFKKYRREIINNLNELKNEYPEYFI